MRVFAPILWGSVCLCIAVGCNQEDPIRHGIISFKPTVGAARYKVTILGFGFGKSTDDVQVSFDGVPAPLISVQDSAIVVTAPENVKTGLIDVSVLGKTVTSVDEFVVLPGTWVQRASLPVNFLGGPSRFYPLGFVVGDKLYAGAGKGDPGARPKDWYVYSPVTDQWTRKADIPFAEGLTYAISLAIGSKGYIGIGMDGDGHYLNEFWEYDPSTDQWSRKTDFPGVERHAAAAFSVAGKGFVGLGDSFFNKTQDWWEYDPTTNQWARRSDNPGGSQDYARGFVINEKIYLGVGLSPEWWEYNPASGSWTAKNNMPKYRTDISSGGGFVLNGKGYIVGIFDCWKYDPGTSQWEEQAVYKYGGLGLGATVENRGYYIAAPSGELWEFIPSDN